MTYAAQIYDPELEELLGPINPLDRIMTVTQFPNVAAKTCFPEQISLRRFAEKILYTSAAIKSGLPLLKLGAFGDVPTPKKSLRHYQNFLCIDGVEGDYDGGVVSLDQARELLAAAAIAAIIYTTPSHTSDRPRWRVLCPTARTLDPSEREMLCARVNGALGGILAPESFTNAQAYYYGKVGDNPNYRVEIVEGRAIDVAIELECIGRKGSSKISADTVAVFATEDAALDSFENDNEDLSAIGRDLPGVFDDDQIKADLEVLPNEYADDRDKWIMVGMALHHQFEGGEKGYGYWANFSKRSDKFDAKDQRDKWLSFRGVERPVRFKTVHGFANDERNRLANEDLIGGREVYDDEDLIGEISEATPTLSWVSLLDRANSQAGSGGAGAIKPTLHNVELIVRNDMRLKGIIRRNEFTLNECYRGAPGFRAFDPAIDTGTGRRRPKPTKQMNGPMWTLQDAINGDLWIDMQNNSVRSMIEAPVSQGGYAVKVSDRDLKGAVNLAAAHNPFHPIREYLESLVWDKKPRLDSMFVRYLDVEDNPYHRAISRLPLIAAVTRAFEPGHKWDYVPIIEGPQGCRKSTFVAVLGKHWSCELNGDFSDRKEMVEKMMGAWVLEIPELAGFSKHEVQDIKAAISATSDKVRMPWKPTALDYKRQCIFYGTTNDSEYLRDATGGRRFWPVKCEVAQIDINSLIAEMDQIWAEAYAAYRAMRQKQPGGMLPLYLSGAEEAATAKIAQENRRSETPAETWANQIEVWLERPITDDNGSTDDNEPVVLRNEVTLRDVWVECFGRDLSQLNALHTQQLSQAMKLIPTFYNIGPRRTKKSHGRIRVYRRIGS